MARIDQLIEDIKEMRTEANRRSALRIYQILDGNRRLFSEKIDPDYVEMALKNFETLSDVHSSELNTPQFKRDFEKYYEGLMFYLNKIL